MHPHGATQSIALALCVWGSTYEDSRDGYDGDRDSGSSRRRTSNGGGEGEHPDDTFKFTPAASKAVRRTGSGNGFSPATAAAEAGHAPLAAVLSSVSEIEAGHTTTSGACGLYS